MNRVDKSAGAFVRAAAHNLKLGDKRLVRRQLNRAVAVLPTTAHDSLYTRIAELYLEIDAPQPAITLLQPKLNGRFPKPRTLC